MLISESISMIKESNWEIEVEIQEENNYNRNEEEEELEGNQLNSNKSNNEIILENKEEEEDREKIKDVEQIIDQEENEKEKQKEKDYVQILEESITNRDRYLKKIAEEIAINNILKDKHPTIMKKIKEAEVQVRKRIEKLTLMIFVMCVGRKCIIRLYIVLQLLALSANRRAI